MRLGIIGLPQAGKTTLFNALTGGSQPTGIVSGRIEVHTAVVDVPDPRLDRLSQMLKPKKTIYAKVTYADIAGLDGNAGKSGISGSLLNQLTQMDGFIHVVRCFKDENIPHISGSVDPQRDIHTMDGEFILNDLIAVERKLKKLADERQKGSRDKGMIDVEIKLFQRLQVALSNEVLLRDVDLSVNDIKILTGFGLLSRKPVLIVLNLAEGQTAPPITYDHRQCQITALQGRLEMEIAQLPPEDAHVFLKEYGIEEPGLTRVIRLSYDMLGLHSFFTFNEKEVRAWTVRRGAMAPEAAGVVHSDMERGFIKAEVIDSNEFVAIGSLAEARSKGKLRLEGKNYVVQDGEVLTFRFNI